MANNGMKPITVYSPANNPIYVTAEDEAQLNRARFGGSGITQADNMLACTKIDNNTIRLNSGMYSMQGYMICVTGGNYQNLTVDSGVAGAYRKDLVVAEFIRGGGSTADQFTFKVIKGSEAASESAAEDPTLTQGNLITGDGGGTRQEALYRLLINGETLSSDIQRVANYIGNVYQ